MVIVKSVPVRQNHLKSALESKGSQIEQQNEILILIGMQMLTKAFKIPK